jgi:VanZ family protein
VSERARARGAGVLALAWASGIAWASHQPNPFPFVPPEIFQPDKLWHALAFGVLAWLARRALVTSPLSPRTAFLVAWALSGAWGLVDEVHQSFIPNRVSDPWDAAADAAGAALGAWLAGRRVAATPVRG